MVNRNLMRQVDLEQDLMESEINAAFGLLQLQHVDNALAKRKAIDAQYRALLADVPGIRCLLDAGEKVANYAYFPVQVEDNFPISRDALYERLKEHDIYARRYFYPLISEFPMYRGLPSSHKDNLSAASAASKRILCLPIYPDLNPVQGERIVSIIAGIQ